MAESNERKRLRDHQRRLLEPYGQMFAEIYTKIINSTDDELAQLLDAASTVDDGNCWCMIYDAAQYLKIEATGEVSRRRLATLSAGERGEK